MNSKILETRDYTDTVSPKALNGSNFFRFKEVVLNFNCMSYFDV